MLAVPQLWIVPLPLLVWILVALVLRVRDLHRRNRLYALEGRLLSAMRAVPPEPREDPLERLLSQGGPDTCTTCSRARTVLLEWEWDAYCSEVCRACVWCDAGTEGWFIGVWGDGEWLLHRPTTSDQWERILQLVVAEHLAAIATERPSVPLPHADAVAAFWGSRTDERGECSGNRWRLVLMLNPWLDEASAKRFLLYLGGADPRTVAPTVVPPMRDLLPVARDALDELALLRAELAAAPDATEPAYRLRSDLEAPDCRVVIQTFLCELDGTSVPRHSLRVPGPLQVAKSDGWNAQDWKELLTEVRQARAELAALA